MQAVSEVYFDECDLVCREQGQGIPSFHGRGQHTSGVLHKMVSYLKIAANAVVPQLWLVVSAAFFGLALSASQRWWRFTTVALFLFFCTISITAGKTSYWFAPGLSNLWHQSVLVCIVHTLTLVHDDKIVHDKPSPSLKETLRKQNWQSKLLTVYKLSWNPRRVPILSNSGATEQRRAQHLSFYALGFLKLFVYYQLQFKLLPALFDETIVEIQPQDVSPELELLLSQLANISMREALVRAYISVYWIWESIVYTDGAHTAFAMFFVFLGLDTPQDWPTLFGKPSGARSIRTFWTKFWHSIVIRPYKSAGAIAARRVFGVPQGSPMYAVAVTFTVFAISGVSHAIVAWYAGYQSWERNIYWYLLNFLACIAETAVMTALRKASKSSGYLRDFLHAIENSWVGELIGYIWVCTFLFLTVPMLKYPAEYQQAIAMENMKRIFSGMSVVSS